MNKDIQTKGIGDCWWLEEDCKKCRYYPDCPFVEINLARPRGCSQYKEQDERS